MVVRDARTAREMILERISWDSKLKRVWEHPTMTGFTYVFLEVDSNATRVLWAVGPRGAVQRVWSYTAEQWEVLQ